MILVILSQNGAAYDGSQTTIFRVTLAGDVSVVAVSAGIRAVYGRLIEANDGTLYGSSFIGLSGTTPLTVIPGSVFRLSTGGSVANVHEFTPQEGYSPLGELVELANGELAGITPGSNRNDPTLAGTVFAVTPGGSLRTIHRFSIVDGLNPYAPLLRGSDGALYGTTLNGGPWLSGVIFRIQP